MEEEVNAPKGNLPPPPTTDDALKKANEQVLELMEPPIKRKPLTEPFDTTITNKEIEHE